MLWLYDMPTWLMGLFIVGTFTGLSVIGLYATRRLVLQITGPGPGHNEGVDAYIGAAAVLYGLVAGLIAVAAWEQYASLDDKVTQEASSLGALYRNVEAYREPYGSKLRSELRGYTLAVIDGWPQLQNGKVPIDPANDLNTFESTLYSFEPKSERERLIDAAAITELDHMTELRRERLHNKDAGLPRELWAVVLIGGTLTMFLTYFLALERFKVHLVMTIVSSVMAALLIFMIATVDHPFRGEVSIGPDAFQLTYDQLMSQQFSSR